MRNELNKSQAIDSLFSRSLSVFLTAVETRKFSLTAQKLGVTQSSVSQTISLLEDKLGFNLFERESRPLQPTQEAMELYRSIKKSDEELRQILIRIQLRNWVKPTVRLGMIESVGHLIAADVCKDLKKDLGIVSLSSGSSGALFNAVLSDSLDIAVVAGEEENKEIKKIALYEDPWYVIFPKNAPKTALKQTWQSLCLCGLPLIYHSRDTADGAILHEHFLQQNIVLPKIFEVQSNDFNYDLVSKGLGWSLTHFLGLLGAESKIDSLRIEKAPSSLKSRKIYLICKKGYSPEILSTVKQAILTSMKNALEHRKSLPAFSLLIS